MTTDTPGAWSPTRPTKQLVELTIAHPSNVPLHRPAELLAAMRELGSQTDEDYKAVADLLMDGKTIGDEIEAERKLLKGPIDEAARTVQALFRPAADALTELENLGKRKLAAYRAEQKRKADEAQRVHDEAADRERKRLATVAANNAEKARLLDARGETNAADKARERAAEFEERAETVVAPMTTIAAPKVSGIVGREVWKFEVTDLAALVAAVAAGKAPLALLLPNDKKLAQLVTALQGEFKADGVRTWPEEQLAAGKRR